MSRRHASIMGACCLAAAATIACEAAEVGVIIDYSPVGATLYLERGGVKQPVRIATPVEAGDNFQLPAGSSVTVELADSRRLSSSGPGTWAVPASSSLGSIASYFHRMALIMEPDYRRTGSAITRGLKSCNREPILVPVLPPGALVKAGKRGLTLAWTGGCAPYRLELKSEHGMLDVKTGLMSREFRFEQVSLEPGSYSVSISDGRGTKTTLQFTARIDGPTCPQALATNSSHLGTVARALWLSDIDQGVWRMDGVELLVPLKRQHDPLAEAVSEEIIEQGSKGRPAAE